MDGPDLSHLLDVDDSLRPSQEVLDGIVLRHRRIRVRRARAAATIGLVIVVAGAGVGIGLSHRGTTASAISPSTSAPANSSITPPAFAATGRSAPKGLGWVAVGSGTSEFSPTASSSRIAAGTSVNGLSAAARLQVTGSYNRTQSPECALLGCATNPPFAGVRGVSISHLFTRTSHGVTVRAFTAAWSLAPLELVPVTSGATASRAPTTGSEHVLSICAVTRSLIVEVSDAGAVGVVTVPLGLSTREPISVLEDEVVGVAERSPIAVVVSHTHGAVSVVRADFVGGGTDEMKVVDGWVVLVHPLALAKTSRSGGNGAMSPLGVGTIAALKSDGTVMERADLPGSGALALAIGDCAVPLGQTGSRTGTAATSGTSVTSGSDSSRSGSAPPTGGSNGG